jgi:hypothetical protein
LRKFVIFLVFSDKSRSQLLGADIQ